MKKKDLKGHIKPASKKPKSKIIQRLRKMTDRLRARRRRNSVSPNLGKLNKDSDLPI